MREQGLQFMADGPQLSRLQRAFLEDLRFEMRMNPDVMIVQSASVEGWEDPVTFVIANEVERVAVQLVPKSITKFFKGFEHHVLSGGDVDAVVRFWGPDLFYFGKDCAAIFAHLHPGFFHRNGLWNTDNEASPPTRDWEPSEPGWETLEIPFQNSEGEDDVWKLRFCWRVRNRPRRFVTAA